MAHDQSTISLGFTEERFPQGTHICQIYSDDDERNESLLKYLLSGLQDGERTACFSEKVDKSALTDFLAAHDVSCDGALQNGDLTLAGTHEVYFEGGRFDPDRMLGLLKKFHEQSSADGYPAARVIGEMAPEIHGVPGGDRLLEYESRVSLLLKEHPVTAVCQYDAHAFDGATIMDVLKVHPLMVAHGSVVRNPYYIRPEEYLA